MDKQELLKEVKYGLGLSNDAPDDKGMETFLEIQELYDKRAGNCFFCSSIYALDPNDIKDRNSATICMMCQHKLRVISKDIREVENNMNVKLDSVLH